MKNQSKKMLCAGILLLAAFIAWTLLISFIDVKAIGPNNSKVGFASLNEILHNFTGVNLSLYILTDWLGLVPIAVALGFAILGLAQLIKRKSLLAVDYDILLLGGFYIIVIAVYVFFEIITINYRPTLINGFLEASYPSSTTMLVMCVMPTAAIQMRKRIKNKRLMRIVVAAIIAFIAFMVLGRAISGVHWITDIIGGAIFSAGIVLIYNSLYIIKSK